MTDRLDSDGDVNMTVPQPVFEFIKAPKLQAWDQASLIKWSRERRLYEQRVQERCVATGEALESVMVSVKSSVEPLLLERLARYIIRLNADLVVDEDITTLVHGRTSQLKNAHIPDVASLFKNLRMDLSQGDVEARVVNYFGDFDRIIEENGLLTMLGAGDRNDPTYRDRMKMRCTILIDHLSPDVVKTEVTRLVKLQHRDAKTDELRLFDIILERAREQQHHHQMLTEVGGPGARPARREERPRNGGAHGKTARKGDADPARTRPAGGGSAPVSPPLPGAAPRAPPKTGCWFCKGQHWLKDCPTATEEDKAAATAGMRSVRENRPRYARAVRVAGRVASRNHVIVNDVFELPFIADTGADCNLIPRQVVEEMQDLGIIPSLRQLPEAIDVEVAGGTHVRCSHECVVDIQIGTLAGNVNVRSVRCLVLGGREECFLLGKPTLEALGIDMDRMLAQLAAQPTDDGDDITEGATLDVDAATEIMQRLEELVAEAEANGFPAQLVPRLRTLLCEYADCFRVRLGADKPAKVEPLRVTLKDGAVPIRCRQRRYPETQSVYMKDYVKQLADYGFVKRNNQSKWASATVLVRKQGTEAEYRITNDYRPVNAMTIPLAGTMPNLAVAKDRVRGCRAIGTFDLFKGFWQFPLHEDSQEYFSFMTDDGVYTPTRVPQGAMDSAVHFQNQMQSVLADMLYISIIVWIDDVVLFAQDEEGYLDRLHQFLSILRDHNIKLSAMKSTIFARSVKWCGRVIDGHGIEQDPDRVSALVALPVPTTAAELQYFLCAANWMRDSLVDFARVFGPLQTKLDQALNGRSRRAREAAKVQLDWPDEDLVYYRDAVGLLAAPARLNFPDDDATVCLFTDASDRGWAAVVTQVCDWDTTKGITEQQHGLLVCKGGCFNGAQLNWSVVEKEAYPIIRACVDLEYLLRRTGGFKLYCDHANLIKIFCPTDELKQHVRGKLQRWSMGLVGLKYDIEHIAGSDNVWADLISRWLPTATDASKHVAKAVRTRSRGNESVLRPLQADAFEWPSRDRVVEAQNRHIDSLAVDHWRDEDGVIYANEKVWIPTEAKDLMTSVLITAHCGIQGHRGAHVMIEQLKRNYQIANLDRVVRQFVGKCLLCKHVKGSKLVQRPWGEHTNAARRNEAIHMDYLFMGKSHGTERYILVLKDELTHYCELVACDTPTSGTAAQAVLDWHKRFGLPEQWVSDQGSHFKCALMELLAERLRGVQYFTPVYSPWLNGTVERLNKDILQVTRVLLLESNLDTRSWTYLLPLIQANLNQSPVASLAHRSPVELFTGLQPNTVLDTIIRPAKRNGEFVLTNFDDAAVTAAVDTMRASLHGLHRAVIDEKERRQLHQMATKNGTNCNFHVGDYVLWSRVDSRLDSNKLMVTWLGPFRVIEARPFTFMIEHLLTGAKYEVHASRLKYFAAAGLDVSEEINEHVSRQGMTLAINEIVAHRYNARTRMWELLVSWKGLQPIQDSWEPLSDMYEDVPAMVEEYIIDKNAHQLTAALRN